MPLTTAAPRPTRTSARARASCACVRWASPASTPVGAQKTLWLAYTHSKSLAPTGALPTRGFVHRAPFRSTRAVVVVTRNCHTSAAPSRGAKLSDSVSISCRPRISKMSTTEASRSRRQNMRLRVLSTQISTAAAAEGLYAPMTAASLGGELKPLRDSSGVLGDPAALRLRLAEDGYLFLQGFHERAAVMEGRRELLEYLASCDDDPAHPIFKPGTARDDAVFGGRAFTPSHRSWPGPGGDQRGVRPAFLNVVNAPKLMDFFTDILGGRSATFDHKWLRVVPPGNGNSAHCDIVYMGNGARDLYTVWTPLGDVPLEMGPLAVATGSHRHQKLQSTYTTIDTHHYLSIGPDFKFAKVAGNFLGAQWASSSFVAGDILVFSAYLLHAPLTNTTDKLRLSSDTRYQLASETQDQRHMGWIPDEFERMQGERTLQEACQEWGLQGMLQP